MRISKILGGYTDDEGEYHDLTLTGAIVGIFGILSFGFLALIALSIAQQILVK